MAVFISFGIVPTPVAQASILNPFSFFTGNVSKKDTPWVDNTPGQNSQTIAFLEAATNADPSPLDGNDGGIVFNDNALFSDVGPSGTMVDIQSNDYHGHTESYTVHQGDTLAQVAEMFGLNVDTIIWANDLSRTSVLKKDQVLTILPVDGVLYTVQKGDTLNGIAKKYKADTGEVATFNELGESSLVIGQQIVIPNGIDATTVAITTPASKTKTSSSRAVSYPSYEGYFASPLPSGRKTQGLHDRCLCAVDLAAPKGTSILAAADGVIQVSHFAEPGVNYRSMFGGFGNFVIIDHPNGTWTRYAHMNQVYVREGMHVTKGQVIGMIGNTGSVSPLPSSAYPDRGTHLHFEVHGARNPF